MIALRDLDDYLSQPGLSIREVMARINATQHLFQLVVDDERRILGTATDGDIRRALLQGTSLDAEVRHCMRTDFVAKPQHETQNSLERAKRAVTFLPVVDDDGRLIEVLVRSPETAGIGQALVMAGGFGRRLGERTLSTPKPLLQVGDRPLLDHVLTALEDAGVGRVHVSVHYLADQIRGFIAARDNRAEVDFIEEESPLGTAGALSRLDGKIAGPILVVNGDVLTFADLAALHDFHRRHRLDGTIAVTQHELEVPFGVVRYDEEGLFVSIEEKPRISNFIAAGVYYLEPEFTALVTRGMPMDMPELLMLGRQIGLKIGLFPIHEYWTDVGQPDDLEAADRMHSRSDPVEPDTHKTGRAR